MKMKSVAAMPKSTESKYRLLGTDEPAAFEEFNRHGRSRFVFAVDHASARVPARLADLGLPSHELQRHIAWDIGALAVAKRAAAMLDAPLIAQNYSRLVIDCNRDPGVATSIPVIAEFTPIPGNTDLAPAELAARRGEIFEPYHRQIRAVLDERLAAGRETILVAQHSMTNIFKGVTREMHAAVLYNRDRRFADLMLQMLRRESELYIADNQPYFVSDETDYTIPRHGEARGLLHVEIEIRQDLIVDEVGQIEWARRIANALDDARLALS
jgi:predicted N-formylglutamate amidohydrolase